MTCHLPRLFHIRQLTCHAMVVAPRRHSHAVTSIAQSLSAVAADDTYTYLVTTLLY